MSNALERPEGRLSVCSGTLESLKWLAVILMTVDHINFHLLKRMYPFMYDAGRIALPLFVFVLAFNLAQPAARDSGAAIRVLGRLVPVAVISSLPYMELNLNTFGFFPLNVLFTLAGGTAIVALLECPTTVRMMLAALLFAVTGMFVDFGWPGIGLFVAIWRFFRQPALFWGASMLVFLLLLEQANSNQWALGAIPIVGAAFFLRIPLPRVRNALYYYYPLHLAGIVALRILVFDS